MDQTRERDDVRVGELEVLLGCCQQLVRAERVIHLVAVLLLVEPTTDSPRAIRSRHDLRDEPLPKFCDRRDRVATVLTNFVGDGGRQPGIGQHCGQRARVQAARPDHIREARHGELQDVMVDAVLLRQRARIDRGERLAQEAVRVVARRPGFDGHVGQLAVEKGRIVGGAVNTDSGRIHRVGVRQVFDIAGGERDTPFRLREIARRARSAKRQREARRENQFDTHAW